MPATPHTAQEIAPSEQLAHGKVADRYLLLGKLGSGGMGAVYRARDESTGRDVALKQLRDPQAADKRATAIALFEREFHTLAGLKHPHIIEVYDYGHTPEGP